MESMMVAGYQMQDSRFYQYELGLFDDEYYETVFREPESTSYLVRSMRPSFKAEIEKYIGAEEIDTVGPIVADSVEKLRFMAETTNLRSYEARANFARGGSPHSRDVFT